ncbi:MFS transporter [Homoserinibacter gongjuensis]|uniref:MFS transporter n=1 Tax=Homoserinibacter gongjuensis TaxID=1162968 RepID=A0ABQ6JQV6_9MICO|nr:MFS transporter [Homoserinibacter gongjuensis]GMA89778.1 MFS transporter [Homoserinibacter gongjuensis]
MSPATASAPTGLTESEVARVRRRSRAAIIAGQVLAGIGMGSTLSAGALLITEVSGSETLSGMAATMATIGAAIAAVPLAALATTRGRAPALATGAVIAAVGACVGLVAAILGWTLLLLAGIVLLGVGTAVNLQARFAATDLSEPNRRGRDLSVVVWATTVGAVLGPNLIGPGADLGAALGLPPLAGPYLFTIGAQLLAAVVYVVGLRPDPLRLATRIGLERPASPEAAPRTADVGGIATGMVATSLSHATMVSVMAMTPVHLVSHGASLELVGLTISLHVLGMYALSPVWGTLADRVGREVTIALGQVLLLAALLLLAVGAESELWVTVGLVMIGLGWSAASVAGATLISESVDVIDRARIQGRADLLMSSAGALGGGFAGLVLAALGYGGLALSATGLSAIVLATLAWRGLRRRAVA